MSSVTQRAADTVGPIPIPSRPGFSSWTVAGTNFEVQDRWSLLRAVGTGVS
jgi:hypothetical protein